MCWRLNLELPGVHEEQAMREEALPSWSLEDEAPEENQKSHSSHHIVPLADMEWSLYTNKDTCSKLSIP